GSQPVPPMLRLAEIATLVDVRVDAACIRAENLRVRPAPDLFLAACGRLGVEAAHAVGFVHNPEGVAAGRAAGMPVIAVAADEAARERLSGFGADRVVPSLGALLDRRLLAA